MKARQSAAGPWADVLVSAKLENCGVAWMHYALHRRFVPGSE
jgi:hypothetical protein